MADSLGSQTLANRQCRIPAVDLDEELTIIFAG